MVGIFDSLDGVKDTLQKARARNNVAGLMARLAREFDEPCEANVDVGDMLVIVDHQGAHRSLPITEVGVVGVYADSIYVEYQEAIVEKPRELTARANERINELANKRVCPLSKGRYLIGSAAKKDIESLYACNPSAN